MTKIITEQTRFMEAYKCSNSHVFAKRRRGMDTLMFYKCCPGCGSMKISVVTGYWEEKYEVTGRIFRKKTLASRRFIESLDGASMDKHTLTLDEYIKIKLRKGESEFDIGVRYTCGEVYIDNQSLSRISFKIKERSGKT